MSGGAAVVAVMLASLLLSGLGQSAQATDGPSTDPTTNSAAELVDPSVSAAETDEAPAPEQKAADSGGSITTRTDNVSIQIGTTKSLNVLNNDTCSGDTPCKRSSLLGFTATGPAGWTVTPSSSTGSLRIKVPLEIVSGTRVVTYKLTEFGVTVSGKVNVKVTLPETLDHYNPPQGSKFSHAFVRGSSQDIRRHTLRTINSVGKGGQIRILSWSFSSPAYVKALFRAKHRGVSVQIIVSQRNTAENSDYERLVKLFGGNRWNKDSERGSWVYKCRHSCRGKGGTMHSKIFLFSQATNTRWIVMSGSGNMTDFAAQRQWNQQYTVTRNKPVYDAMIKVFKQSKKDRVYNPVQLTFKFPTTTMYITPLNAGRTQYDFMYKALRQVSCTGADTKSGRTRIRISMYVWRDDRGDWMARQVRKLWNEGCDVRILYSIMGNRNKSILYSPSGRGRIPMRQTILVDEEGEPLWYLHQKYVAIGGKIGTNPRAYAAYQGSFNFSDLGMRSDENFQKINGYGNYRPYIADFNGIWGQRQTRAPSPTSNVSPSERPLGTGLYRYMEPN